MSLGSFAYHCFLEEYHRSRTVDTGNRIHELMLLRQFTWSLFAVCILSLPSIGQELPPIQVYGPDDYRGGNQNWALTQGEQRFLYAANNKGLLEFNGMQWKLHPSPNETIIRCVQAYDGKVYSGCYMEFGVWEYDDYGQLQYQSLSDSVRDYMVADEHFWNILVHQGMLIFQSLDQVFTYNPDTGEVNHFAPPKGIDKLFASEQRLLFTDETRQLYELNEGRAIPLTETPLPSRIVYVQLLSEGIRILTDSDGFFFLEENGELNDLPETEAIADARVYSSLVLQDGRLVLGTIANGLFVLDRELQLIHHVAQVNGLSNNTVLSLFEDVTNNIWAGTDNGISCINLGSAFRKFTDRTGRLGTIYAAKKYQNKLYLGTNQGLFVREPGQPVRYKLVSGTKGQVWSLFAYDDVLFCGHDQGTFIIQNDRAVPVFTKSGTWQFTSVANRPDLIVQGNYDGLSVLERKEGGWSLRNKITGFDLSARFLGLVEEHRLYISHEYKGVFGLQLDSDYRQVEERKDYTSPGRGKNAGLVRFQDKVLYSSREGVFILEGFAKGFRKDDRLSRLLGGDQYESGRMAVEGDARLWCFTRNQVVFLDKGSLSEELTVNKIPVPVGLLNVMSGYENIELLDNKHYLIGTAEGYLMMDLADLPELKHNIFLTKAERANVQRDVKPLPLGAAPAVPYQYNSLSFEFTVPAYSRFFVPKFRYRLVGLVDTWSEWSGQSSLSFRNLAYGRYRLEIQSKLGQQVSNDMLTYSFAVSRPWYATYFAVAIYVLLGILIVYFVHRAYTRYYQQQKEKWRAENQRRIQEQQREAELEVVRLRNEQLQQDVDSKNRELAISTMSLVKKNELLHQIKSALRQEGAPDENIRKVIRTIDQNTNEEETWNFFKEAFENADRDFFKKIQQQHPSLTHNDLKLCAYLRLNLSSKEIAPLLNISVRSVEVKRYRLRKKMSLQHDEGLVEYILTI